MKKSPNHYALLNISFEGLAVYVAKVLVSVPLHYVVPDSSEVLKFLIDDLDVLLVVIHYLLLIQLNLQVYFFVLVHCELSILEVFSK